MATLEPYAQGYYLWDYVPSLAAAIIFDILFFAITSAHCYYLWKTKLWFCSPFAIGGIFEVIGFSARIAAHFGTGKLMPYIIQNTFILLPPALFAASIYMVLGRIVRARHGEQYLIIRVTRLTKTFVLGDVFSFLVQGSAAGLMAMGDNAQMGQNIVVAGLLIQIIMFGLFAVTAVLFQYRYQQYKVAPETYDNIEWKQMMMMLYGVSLLIMVRSIFRVIEFAVGKEGYLLQNEWTLYIFDALLMWIVMVVFFMWYPDKVQQKGDVERVNSDGTEICFTDREGS